MSIGKMKKHQEMLQHPILRQHLPETYWLTPEMTLLMLKSYSSIFIKPNYGSGGTGIIRVKRMRNGYEVRYGQKRKYIRSGSLDKAIQSYQKPSSQYLVQRGLRLAQYNGSIFDIRMYMQKPDTEWVISGMVARVAAPNNYVTNYYKGGHAEPLNKVLSNLFENNKEKVDHILKRITDLSYVIAEILNKHFPGIRELGIDLGIDKNDRVWIIEANSKPGFKLFTKLSNKSMLLTIMKNKKMIKKLNAANNHEKIRD